VGCHSRIRFQKIAVAIAVVLRRVVPTLPPCRLLRQGGHPKTGVPNVSSRRISRHFPNLVDRVSLMRFIRYLTATSTLLLTALLTLVLLFYSVSVALGVEGYNGAVERECLTEAVRYPATRCVGGLTDGGFRSRR
jgi:hypothetical protein